MNYQPTPPPSGKNRKLVIALVFLCAAVVLLCCAGIVSGALGGNDKATGVLTAPEATFDSPGAAVGSAGASAAKSAAPKTVPSKAPVAAAPVVLGAGDYEVAKTTSADELTIAPGTYAIKADGYHCYWARVSGFGGELSDIIANDNLFNGATARVTIKKSDKGLHLTGNCEAQRK